VAASQPERDITQVYETHFRYVWRCLRSLGVRSEHLDDALQDVFIVVQRRLAEFDGKAQLSTWLYAIALRIARKYRVRARLTTEPIDAQAEARPAPAGDQEATLQVNERLQLARAALAALDDEKREIFVLSQVEQMSAPEIASITGLPLNTVYSRLRAARQAFAARVLVLTAKERNSA
jgi:RNA polymerase sigma-70 factor (ECF subfamily)